MQKTSTILIMSLILVILLFSFSSITSARGNIKKIDMITYKDRGSTQKIDGNISCYNLIGMKNSRLPSSAIINPKNSAGLSENLIKMAYSNATNEWNSAIGKKTFFSGYSLDNNIDYVNNPIHQDYKNVIWFQPMNSEILAFTSVYADDNGIFEYDIGFNDANLYGNAASNSSVYDFQGVLTHELGHTLGLNDVYDLKCISVTMFKYGYLGSIDQRTLERADKDGLKLIYR